MLDVLRFIFSSFWIWAGTVILIYVATDAVADWVKALKRKT